MKTILFYPKLEPAKMYHYFPISLLAAAAPMTGDIKLIDERVDDSFTDEIGKASHLMISAYTGYQVSRAYAVSKWVKENYPHIHITWGGPHASTLPEQTLASGVVDEVVIGDVDDGKFPLPYHLIDIEKYVNPDTRRFAYVTSYSCVGNCSFCQTTPRRKLIFLPQGRIEKDINNLMSMYKFKEAWFCDATIFTKPERALFIANLMRKYGLKWMCDSRADEICKTNKSMLNEIIDSKITRITIGLESGSPAVIQNMNKGKNHLQNFKKCAEIMSKYDVEMCSGVIFGTPGEGPEDIIQTIQYIEEIAKINPRFRISSTFYKPLPRTRMSEMCAEYGYKEPQSLEEWCKLGESGHYNYNQFNALPWIREIDQYKAIYEDFKTKNAELFV